MYKIYACRSFVLISGLNFFIISQPQKEDSKDLLYRTIMRLLAAYIISRLMLQSKISLKSAEHTNENYSG